MMASNTHTHIPKANPTLFGIDAGPASHHITSHRYYSIIIIPMPMFATLSSTGFIPMCQTDTM